MSIHEERKEHSEGAGASPLLLAKPTTSPGQKKRSLTSFLSLDHDSEEGEDDALVDTLPSKKQLNNSNAISNKKRKTLSIDSKWELKDIPALPFLYLKEKTSVVVMNDDPQQVASRIVQCAKKISVYGQYSTEKAKATLTLDDMNFSIQLFKVSDKKNSCVIVEIQRTSGSSIQFHKTARVLLQAAKERGYSNTSVNDKTSAGSTSDSPRCLLQLQPEVALTHTLDVVDALLKKDRVDAYLLGMESLQLLTTQKSASNAMVQFASNVVVAGEQFENIRDTIVSLIQNNSDQDEEHPDAQENYCHKIHTCALSVLSNALKNTTSKNDAVQSLGNLLFDSLIGELNRADINPRNAYLACKCLKEIFLKSVDMRNRGLELDVYNDIRNSQRIGKTSYPLLEEASENVLQILGEAKDKNSKDS